MHHAALRNINGLPACPASAQTQICFFEVEKKPLIKTSRFHKDVVAHHEASAGNPVHRLHLTRLRQQINHTGSFIGSNAEKAWLRADIGPVMLSCKPLPDGGFSSIGIYRTAERELFTERESKIAHIVLTEIPWLHLTGWPEERGQSALKLYPRLRTVLNLLIEGWSRKQIADRLDLSLNTIHGYVKDIYRHFSVHSQAELLARLSKGDGGDQAEVRQAS